MISPTGNYRLPLYVGHKAPGALAKARIGRPADAREQGLLSARTQVTSPQSEVQPSTSSAHGGSHYRSRPRPKPDNGGSRLAASVIALALQDRSILAGSPRILYWTSRRAACAAISITNSGVTHMFTKLTSIVSSAAIVFFAVPHLTRAETSNPQRINSVVLVHGGFVDGSGWEGVYRILKKKGYDVIVVQNPTNSLADDVAVTRRAIESAKGDVILVGHSYGGVVISEAGNHKKVAGLVYITAFAPDSGESVSTLIASPAPGGPVPPILPPVAGYLFLDRAKFAASFAADVEPKLAAFIADSQVPWGIDALNGAVTSPAWRWKPSWYLVATEDKMIPPAAQRSMAERAGAKVAETAGSHAVYVAKPGTVAAVIERAAAEARLAQPKQASL